MCSKKVLTIIENDEQHKVFANAIHYKKQDQRGPGASIGYKGDDLIFYSGHPHEQHCGYHYVLRYNYSFMFGFYLRLCACACSTLCFYHSSSASISEIIKLNQTIFNFLIPPLHSMCGGLF